MSPWGDPLPPTIVNPRPLPLIPFTRTIVMTSSSIPFELLLLCAASLLTFRLAWGESRSLLPMTLTGVGTPTVVIWGEASPRYLAGKAIPKPPGFWGRGREGEIWPGANPVLLEPASPFGMFNKGLGIFLFFTDCTTGEDDALGDEPFAGDFERGLSSRVTGSLSDNKTSSELNFDPPFELSDEVLDSRRWPLAMFEALPFNRKLFCFFFGSSRISLSFLTFSMSKMWSSFLKGSLPCLCLGVTSFEPFPDIARGLLGFLVVIWSRDFFLLLLIRLSVEAARCCLVSWPVLVVLEFVWTFSCDPDRALDVNFFPLEGISPYQESNTTTINGYLKDKFENSEMEEKIITSIPITVINMFFHFLL